MMTRKMYIIVQIFIGQDAQLFIEQIGTLTYRCESDAREVIQGIQFTRGGTYKTLKIEVKVS